MRRPNKSDEKFGTDSGRQEGWWSSKEASDDFISTVRRTEIEMCLNVDLMNRINCSKDVNTLYTISSSIAYRQHILDAKFDDYSFNQRSLTHELL